MQVHLVHFTMLFPVAVIVLSAIITTAQAACYNRFPGYYWRDFDGTMPPDAFPAGYDAQNNTIYIAQTLVQGDLIPGSMYPNNGTAYSELYDVAYAVKDNLKIFCTPDPEQFEWIPTNNQNLKQINGKNLVKGGYHPGLTTNIGRTRTGNEVLVGKVMSDNSQNHYIQNGVAIHGNTYEVLAFNINCANAQVGYV